MAYAAVISLKQTLHRLLHSSEIFVNVSSTRKFLQYAHKQAISLQHVLKRLEDNCRIEKLNAVDEQIREEMNKLEDVLEFHESNLILAQSESSETTKRKIKSASCEEDSEEIKQRIQSLCVMVEKMRKEIGHPSPEDEDDDIIDRAVPSDLEQSEDSFDDCYLQYHLTERMRPNDFGFFQITGLPGSGATIVATTIFEGLKHCFDCCAVVRVGPIPICERKEMLLNILAQINEPNPNPNELLSGKGDEEIGEFLYNSLKGRRYMIVVDDIRSVEIWNFLERFFPVQDDGSAVLFTTRGPQYELRIRNSFLLYNLASRHQDSWWYLLRHGVFGAAALCPPQLEEAGKKIVRNCKGLRIVVLKVILLLLKADNTAEYWNKLAADQENPIFMIHDELSEINEVQEELASSNYSFIDDEKRAFLLELIAFPKHIEAIKMEIFPKMYFPKMLTLSFLGMAGIGKTSLVKKIFEDPTIRCRFDHHLWVDLGPGYNFEEILVDIVAKLRPDIDKNCIKGDEDLCKSLGEQLFDKKCLLVLDDVWSKKSLHYLRKFAPNIKGTALVTTRLSNVAQTGQRDVVFKMRLMNKEKSWDLFCEHLFGEERCPMRLEKAGKKIVENCEGLPLMIVTVARLLREAEKTPECWKDAAQKNSPVFMAAYDQISKILVPSYEYLPEYLKVCFLYIGIFPQEEVIPASKLIILWTAEGFLEPSRGETIQDHAAECLSELDNRSLVVVSKKGSGFKVKTCSLHSVFWHLSNSRARENKFFHAICTRDDSSSKGMKKERRLCIRNSTLLSIKDVHDLIASISTTRSLLCIAPAHQYPVPVYFGLRLLRLMDALSIHLYEFPIEVVKSYCLRYLALTFNGNLPCDISRLRSLQFLIVGRHLSIKSSTDSSYLPIEIWDMEGLKHVEIAGSSSNLPDPSRGVVLRNLSTLLGVSADSCTKKVLKGVPSVKRLGIRIELEPDEKGNPFRCLNRISRLHWLESLKCVVVNPDLVISPPAPRSMFPSGLKKLSLSGIGYPWEYMKIISKLDHLQVLKLRCYAFQGPEWEMDDDDLSSLRFLLIEDTDLIRWKFSMVCFMSLKCLSMRHCYQLEELPRDLSTSIQTIEVDDCNPFVENWANELEEDVCNLRNISSWDATNVVRS